MIDNIGISTNDNYINTKCHYPWQWRLYPRAELLQLIGLDKDENRLTVSNVTH